MNYIQAIKQQLKRKSQFQQYYNSAFKKIQKDILIYVEQYIDLLDTANGKILDTNDLNSINELEEKILKKIDVLIKQISFDRRLNEFNANTLQVTKDINGINKLPENISNIRLFIEQQTRYSLQRAGIMQGVTKPLNMLLQNIILEGTSKAEAKELLNKWNKGEGEALFGSRGQKKIQNFEQYFNQIANDSVSQFNGNIQNTIRKEFNLNGFIYVGGEVEKTRPFCHYLVSKFNGAKIPYDAMESIIHEYLKDETLNKGMIEGTTVENICVYKGGYNCLHECYSVLMSEEEIKEFYKKYNINIKK